MSFFPPVGPLGERAGPPVPYQVPASRHEDQHDGDWREEELRRPRRPRRQRNPIIGVLLGILVVALALAAFVFLVSGDSDQGLDGAILGPDDGARLSAGRVAFRVRVGPSNESLRWELAYTRRDGDGWRQVAEGQSPVQPSVLPARGVFFVDITQPGSYRARLLVTGTDGVEVEDTIDFLILE